MNSVVHFILPYVLAYKYWAIFVITFFAALALPIPPGTLLMASAAFAGQGYFNFWYVVLAGVAGNVAGDNLGYWLARLYGKRILYKIGFRKFLDSKKYLIIEERMNKNPGLIILISRFEVFSNLCVNLLAGMSDVSYVRYLFFEATGEIAQVTLYCGIGYVVGDNWQNISALLNNFFLLLLLVVVVLVVIFWKKMPWWKKSV